MPSNVNEFQAELANQQRQQQSMSNQGQDWHNKLVGKKIVEHEVEASHASNFSKRDLPEKHRVIAPGTITTRDFYPDRLNVHVDGEGTCTHVVWG
ncbi:hypothetical protein RUND412_011363 [Rhizina undulata]